MTKNSLQTQMIEGIETGVLSGRSQKAIVLFHGFGANRHDLVPLAQFLDPNQNFTWYFPNGILKIPISPFYDARAWAEINLPEYEKAMRENRYRHYMKTTAVAIEKPSQLLTPFLKELHNRHNQILIGGFSQGSMLALDLALSSSLNIQNVILLSSTFLAEERWQSFLEKMSYKMNIFQSHGKLDPILPFDNAKLLSETLKTHHDVDFYEFVGGHEIPTPVLNSLKNWLSKI